MRVPPTCNRKYVRLAPEGIQQRLISFLLFTEVRHVLICTMGVQATAHSKHKRCDAAHCKEKAERRPLLTPATACFFGCLCG